MSKTTVRKALAGLEASELRELMLDIYARSKDARALLDFYAVPDIQKLYESFEARIDKELARRKRRMPAPRIAEIKRIVKDFSRFDPGEETIGELMAETVLKFCTFASGHYVDDRLAEQMCAFFDLTLQYIIPRRMMSRYGPRFNKEIDAIRPHERYCAIRILLRQTLDEAEV